MGENFPNLEKEPCRYERFLGHPTDKKKEKKNLLQDTL
jgi:hypothetical protein